MNYQLPENEWFYCEHLNDSVSAIQEVNEFTINPKYSDGAALADYVQSGAFHDEKKGECRTYLVRDKKTKELAAYFTLRSGIIFRNGIFIEDEPHTFNMLSGTELVCFATNYTYLKKHPENEGFGIIVFEEMILPIVKHIGNLVGAAVLFGYAVNDKELMDYYIDKCGFSRLPEKLENKINESIKPEFDRGCYFIYQPLFD